MNDLVIGLHDPSNRVRRRVLVLASLLLSPSLFVGTAAAQAPAPPPPAPADTQCFPACRAGFICNQGQCVSACNPPCATGQVCAPSGQCVSACNPPCATGQTCTADGQCAGGAAPPAPPYAAPPPGAPPPYPPAGYAPPPPAYAQPAPYGAAPGAPSLGWGGPPAPIDAGWGAGAATFGFISAGVIMALTLAVLANNDIDSADTARTIGIAAIASLGVAAPVTASGGSSARTHPAIIGAPGLRLTSWIGYGVALLDAVVLLALSFDNQIEDAHILSVGLLGSLSTLGFALDARISVQQAEAMRAGGGYRAARPAAAPALLLARTREGGTTPLIGLGWQF